MKFEKSSISVKMLRLAPIIFGAAMTVMLSGCGSSPPPPPQVFPPLDYSYLPPIVLNVSNVTVQNQYVPDPAAATLIGQDPEAPANALMDMARHRLVANGAPGNATFTVENASIEPLDNNYAGTMTVRLDVASTATRTTGFTEASVSLTQTAPDSDATQDQVRAALYGMTKQLMDSMNVQLQYQIQHNLSSWISYSPNAATPALNNGAVNNGGIQAAPLAAPGTAPASGSTAGSPAPSAPSPAMPSLIPPGMSP